MKTLKTFFSAGLLAVPLVGFAAERTFATVVGDIVNKVLTPLIGLVAVTAFLFFMWGLAKYLSGDAKKLEEAKGVMWYSVLAMFVMFSIWGLVTVLMNTFGIDGTEKPPIPKVYP